jgi:fumarylacetoacetate (FAA) hydrolase
MVGTGTVSNADSSTGYACLMEARLVEQVELGEAKTPFLRFGDRVRIEMRDEKGASVFGAIDHMVERIGKPGSDPEIRPATTREKPGSDPR